MMDTPSTTETTRPARGFAPLPQIPRARGFSRAVERHIATWTSRVDPTDTERRETHEYAALTWEPLYIKLIYAQHMQTKLIIGIMGFWRTTIYSSSSACFLERLLLRDLRRFGAAFFFERLFDFLRRLADFRFGAAFLRDARRRRLGAMATCTFSILPRRGRERRETGRDGPHKPIDNYPRRTC